jgi:hypothetical protein
MNPFHEYLNEQLAEKLAERRVVVWYDPGAEFRDYVQELVGGKLDGESYRASIGGQPAHVAVFQGSYFTIRLQVEPLVSGDLPASLLVYLPGVTRDRTGSVLMELEKGGVCYEPQLKRLARNVLRMNHTDGVIDEMLAPEKVSYQDVVSFLTQTQSGAAKASMLKNIFQGITDNALLLAKWLADDAHDKKIEEKEAVPELCKLIGSRLGLTLEETLPVAEARTKTSRYLLVNEFRSDLKCAPPTSVSLISEPSAKEQREFIDKVATTLRKEHPEAYQNLADTVEQELQLATAGISAADLGLVDTFRFEERALLKHCDDLLGTKRFAEALEVAKARSGCFWVQREVHRLAQWEVCRLMAELGLKMKEIQAELAKPGKDAASWANAYTSSWFVADRLHRDLESWLAKMDHEPEMEKTLTVLRQDYEDLLRDEATGFSEAFQASGLQVRGFLPQTKVYGEVVKGKGGVAYFLVDALRFEMGDELQSQLTEATEMVLRPAIAVLPSITPLGMAALLPGASASFSVVEQNGHLAANIEETSVGNAAERMKFFKAKVPDMVEMTLGKLMQTSSGKLAKAIENASVVVVRSQEIDALGEQGDDWTARQVMDSVIGNLARAARKLATAGIVRFVIAADHGHQFSLRKEEDMRVETPGGKPVEVHRRCWSGRGGQNPPGTLRLTGAQLGYVTNLEFVFPTGLGVFKTSGSLSYHHGGCSLQELVIPVLSFRLPTKQPEKISKTVVVLDKLPEVLTNRTFGMEIVVSADLFQSEPVQLRVILLAGDEQVGQAGLVVGAEFDRGSGVIRISGGRKASVGMILTKDDCKSVRVVAQDAKTDAVFAQSGEIAVKLGI